MEFYGRSPARNVSESEWSPVGGETALPESVWQLGLTSFESYPERSGAANCVFYMRTGYCAYGSRCRYNHPRDRAAVAATVRDTGEYPERVGEPACQYFLRTGTCKFGATCKFHHPKHGGGFVSQTPLNIYGYPLRPGENECSYYLKTGHCKFGMTCKFHHPLPAGTSLPASAPQFYPQVQSPSHHFHDQYGGPSTSLRVARSQLLPGSYMQGAYGPVLLSPGVVPLSGWSTYSAPVSPVLSPAAQPPVGAASLYGVSQLSPSTHSISRTYASLQSSVGPSSSDQNDSIFPERPGEQECQYYLRTGDCKFGSSCRYHHPRDRVGLGMTCVLNPLGLPLRPGVKPCIFYLQHGTCKFGSTCKFDHPVRMMRYSPSASSLIDVPVSPYPVGSLLATLAPSSSTSEIRPELISVFRKESHSARLPSSGNTSSSSSVGLIFSQSGSDSHSNIPLSSHSSSQLNGSRTTRQGGETHLRTPA